MVSYLWKVQGYPRVFPVCNAVYTCYLIYSISATSTHVTGCSINFSKCRLWWSLVGFLLALFLSSPLRSLSLHLPRSSFSLCLSSVSLNLSFSLSFSLSLSLSLSLECLVLSIAAELRNELQIEFCHPRSLVTTDVMEVSTTTTCLCVVGASLAVGVYILWGPEYFFKQRGNFAGLITPHSGRLIPTTYRSMCGPAEYREHLLRKCCITGIELSDCIVYMCSFMCYRL